MNDKQHISEAEFISFAKGWMKRKDIPAFLAHIGSCNYCADRLDIYMAGEMLSAPKNLKENILRAVKRPEMQLARKAKETSKRMQLFIYSLKVGTAAVGAILILSLTMNYSNIVNVPRNQKDPVISWNDKNSFSLTGTLRDNMYKLSDKILNFSNNIINMEVTDNDQKEK